MFDEIKLVLLGIPGLLAVIILILAALAKLRDELVNLGWLSEDGRVGKMTMRGQRAQIQRVLREIGFTSKHYYAVKHSVDDAMLTSDNSESQLDAILLSNIKQWTKELEPGFSFRNQSFYVDTMGAMDYVQDESSLARITASWIRQLYTHVIPRPDLLLTPKDGNVALVRQVSHLISPSGAVRPIVCKGSRDHSRVVGSSETAVHISDFEGLEPFLASDVFKTMPLGPVLQVIACDDNCTSGATLCSVIDRFNRFVSEKKLPFQLVLHAVVLFVVKDPETERAFKQAGVSLHALLSALMKCSALAVANQRILAVT